jgi:hypothetical protein
MCCNKCSSYCFELGCCNTVHTAPYDQTNFVIHTSINLIQVIADRDTLFSLMFAYVCCQFFGIIDVMLARLS